MAETDDRLKALERQIKSTYTKAYREMKEEATKLLTKMQSNPDMPMAQKMALMNRYNRLDTLTDQLAKTAQDANILAEKMINNEMVNVYEVNYNGDAQQLGFSLVDHNAIKKILKEEENPFTKINALHDKTAIKNKMKGELMTGLLKGESMQKIAARFKNVSEGYLKNAIRVARTETTRVQNSAKMDVGKHGEELGFVMMKRWVATTDHRVRDDHLAMNGVEVEQDEPFVLPDGSKMMFPADISLGADAGQVINCRCTVVEFIKRDEDGNLVMNGDVQTTEYEHMSKEKLEEFAKQSKYNEGLEYDGFGVVGDGSKEVGDVQNAVYGSYVRSRKSFEINDYLRSGKPIRDDKMGETIRLLDKATTSSELQQDTVLTRFVDKRYIYSVFGGVDVDSVLNNIGAEITEKAYMSTSAVSSSSLFSHKDALLKIRAHKGTKCFPTLNYDESEVILPRGSTYKIMGASVNSKGQIEIDVDIIGGN